MNRRQIALIALVVILVHAALFWLLSGTKPLPKKVIAEIPRPNFFAREARWQDQETGERYVIREFEVSTKLALPDVVMERGDKKDAADFPEVKPVQVSVTP
jgi:hypothetical protein